MKNFRLFFHLYSHKIFLYLFIFTCAFQIVFWFKTESIKPKYDIVPNVPSPHFVKAVSLGDNEFLFRILAFQLQNAGDVYAGFTALKNYDYSRLYQWWNLLDELDAKSNLVPAMSVYYYSQTQNKPDAGYVVKYIDNRAEKNLNENWWWLFQTIYIATNVLNDNDLALKIANKIAKNTDPNAPIWTKQIPAFINARMGNDCLAFKIIQDMVDEDKKGIRKFTPEEVGFMKYFINQRLKNLQKNNFDPNKCKSHGKFK